MSKTLLLVGMCLCLAGAVIALINTIWLLHYLEKRHKEEEKDFERKLKEEEEALKRLYKC